MPKAKRRGFGHYSGSTMWKALADMAFGVKGATLGLALVMYIACMVIERFFSKVEM